MPPPCRRRPNDFDLSSWRSQKLDAALASGTIRCKIERIGAKPKLVKRSDQVAVVFLPDELLEGWEDRPTIYLNDKPQSGWLFLWNYDRIKYFGDFRRRGRGEPVEMQKTAAEEGHPVVHDWREITLFAVQACDFRKLNANAIVHELQDRLADEGVKVPADRELQTVVKQVLTFAERHQQTPR